MLCGPNHKWPISFILGTRPILHIHIIRLSHSYVNIRIFVSHIHFICSFRSYHEKGIQSFYTSQQCMYREYTKNIAANAIVMNASCPAREQSVCVCVCVFAFLRIHDVAGEYSAVFFFAVILHCWYNQVRNSHSPAKQRND